MPLTSANFVYINESPDDIAKFNLALQYLSASPEAEAAMEANQGMTIQFVHNGNDQYANGILSWDPNSGLAVSNNGVSGVQSAAIGLAHEFFHVQDQNVQETSDEAEALATSQETTVANELGEATRSSYTSESGTVTLSNPTEHTDNSHWQQLDADGNVVTGGTYTGPQINPGSAPVLDPGSSGSSGGTGTGSDPGTGGNGSGDDSGGNPTQGDPGDGDSGGDDPPPDNCVCVDSILPDGRTAGEVTVGSSMQLADDKTLEPHSGFVSYSETKTVPGCRFVTQSGISLRCSNTAPIPTPNGYVLAPDLLGKKVPVRRDVDGVQKTSWETVELVEPIGMLKVQHITVGNKCFWAGENKNGYILHHNAKIPDGDGVTIRKGLNLTTVRMDDLKNNTSQKIEHHASVHTAIHANEPTVVLDSTDHAVQLVGVATVHHDIFSTHMG